MSRKKTRRKVHRLINPLTFVLEGIKPTPEEELNKLRRIELCAIDDFAHGRATKQAWFDINAMLSRCETMALDGVGPEAIETCKAAEQALIDANRRFMETGRMGTTGQGLKAFRDLYEYHALQRQSVSRSEYEKFIKKVICRIKSGAPGVRRI